MDYIQVTVIGSWQHITTNFLEWGACLVLGIYSLSLIAITIYCLLQFHLLIQYLSKRKSYKNGLTTTDINSRALPYVTVQLPIFNERYVVERLLKTIVELDYPKDRLEIQVLDDSTDDTIDISAQQVEMYLAQGYDIKLIHRKDRSGYKAGALKAATVDAKGEYIAIFDADFVPEKSFLLDTLKHFADPKVGVVQTRWEHLNQDYSLLTRLQAIQLNVHFTVEQLGRKVGNYLLQFNGTAGVWRKSCISDAGGWEADTLTEDLDLSYRAQLRGWHIIYLEDVTAPAELPAEMNGLRSQQFRWMKGGAETARKVLPQVWRSPLGISQKIHASAHLLGSSVFLAVFAIGIFSIPLAVALRPMGYSTSVFTYFLISTIAIVMVYFVANVSVAWREDGVLKNIIKFVFLFPIFLALSMGLSFHNSLAVIQGYLGRKSPFVRTPKFAADTTNKVSKKKTYLSTKINKFVLWEGFFAILFLGAIIWGFKNDESSFMILHSLLAIGYSMLFFLSIKNVFLK